MKYLVYYENEFHEFSNLTDYQYFLADKPENVRRKRCKTKKEEKEFRELCKVSPVYVKKIYITIEDNKPIRFESWAECEEYKQEHPSAVFKSFIEENEAQDYNNNNSHQNVDTSDILIADVQKKALGENAQSTDVAVELKNNDDVVARIPVGKEGGTSPWLRELRFVVKAIRQAVALKEERILICYYNQGVEMWANGSWACKNKTTEGYRNEIERLSKRINIDFKQKSEK